MGEQERFQNIIRKILAEPDNRICFTCTQKGPVYIVVPFSIFVCTKCSGIHRSFSYRVKGISMSNFSQEEIDDLKKGGNGAARKIWLANWSPDDYPIPDPGDEKKIRGFVRQCFVRGQWKELPPSEPLENLVGRDAVEAFRANTFNKDRTTQGKTRNQQKEVERRKPEEQQQQQRNNQNHQPAQPAQPIFDPFYSVQTPSKADDWDPWGPSSQQQPQIVQQPQPQQPQQPQQPAKPVNPFNTFALLQQTPPTVPAEQPKTFDPFLTPVQQQQQQQQHQQPATQLKPVDVHTLFVTPQNNNTQPVQQVTDPVQSFQAGATIPMEPNHMHYTHTYPVQPPMVHPYLPPMVPIHPWVQQGTYPPPMGVVPGHHVPPSSVHMSPPQVQQNLGPDAFSGLMGGFGTSRQPNIII